MLTEKLHAIAGRLLTTPDGSRGRHGQATAHEADGRLAAFARLSANLNASELCVVCGAETGIPLTLPIQLRHGYVEGVGQCCEDCR